MVISRRAATDNSLPTAQGNATTRGHTHVGQTLLLPDIACESRRGLPMGDGRY